MSSREVARRGCDERGRRGCVGLGAGEAPFIAARRGQGTAVRSSAKTRLQGRWWTGDDARELAMSWR
jgi:hypothetical protein